MYKNQIIIFVFVAFTIILGCKKEQTVSISDSGKIVFKFESYIDGQPLVKDTMKYVNAAGNVYSVSELKYFISDVILHKSDGSNILIYKGKDIQYIDESIPQTATWNVADDIYPGDYGSISFTFGIDKEKNIDFLFVNPPEVNMAWPDMMGGGYHYMMMNGFWKNTTNQKTPFNFHLGIGQIYSGGNNMGTITGFVQNSFPVSLKNSGFTLHKGETKVIQIVMNIDSWFKTPHIYDFNYWGGAIMQNQAAQQMAKENGFDVFTIGGIN
jgi:hypothetical protein